MPLHEESTYLCTFNTPFSRYRYLRLPFGLCSSSDILQQRTYKTFGDIPGVFLIADDMVCASENEAEHDKLLRKVLDRARNENVKFNKNKIQFKKEEVFYMGRRLGKDGIRPDVEKVKSIVEMPNPTDKEGVKRFLGTVNFLSPFIPNMSTVTTPLRSLLKKGVPWEWHPEHETAMTQLKTILASDPVLRLYDPKLPIKIQADASSTGLGACLLQQDQPIAYTSRALTETESRYAQIERELLAIVFAAEQFRHYIYNQEVEVESDHSPLEQIHKKSLLNASPRLQLMLLRLLRYNLNIRYLKGSKMYIADTLSRAYIQGDTPTELGEMRVHSLVADFPASPERLNCIRDATEADPSLMTLKKFIYEGWPSHRGSTPYELQPYWQMRGQLYEEDGILFFGERIIVPCEIRKQLLDKIHESHLGMDKCKARAREILYWPGMDRDIEITVASCSTCATYRRQNTKEPLISHPIPDRPWAKLGADIFDFGGSDYIVVVDYFSKYPEVVKLMNKTAKGVIAVLKPIMARHGIPDTLMADNMPFNSYEMRQFAKEWGFKIVTSSPRYPQSNGQSEKFVGIVKSLLRKAYHEGHDPHLALLEYRNTPVTGMKHSPAQLLMSRRLNDKLPTRASLLEPEIVCDAKVALKKRQDVQKQYYDCGAKSLKSHKVGDSVRVRFDKEWKPAIVTAKHEAPRSYMVTTGDGSTYRRNSKFINTSVEPPPVIIPEDDCVNSQVNEVPCNSSQSMAQPLVSNPIEDNNVSVDQTVDTPIKSPRASGRMRNNPTWMKDYVRY